MGAFLPILRFDGVEADDIAAHLVKTKISTVLVNIWLISSDRDWDLLIQEGVSRFSYVNRKEVRIQNWHDHYEVSPEQYISLKMPNKEIKEIMFQELQVLVQRGLKT